MNIHRIVITGAVALALVAGGTAAGAAIAAGPIDGNGVIHGCYTSKGQIRRLVHLCPRTARYHLPGRGYSYLLEPAGAAGTGRSNRAGGSGRAGRPARS